MDLTPELEQDPPAYTPTSVYIVQGGDICVAWTNGTLNVRGPFDKDAAGFEVFRLLNELTTSQEPVYSSLQDRVDDVVGGTP